MDFSKLNEKQRRNSYIKKYYQLEYVEIIKYNETFQLSNFSQMLYNYVYNIIMYTI